MNVTVENLGPCKKLVRVVVDAAEVDQAFAEVTKGFVRQAALPGFRPGKAPKDMVLKRYEKDIEEETRRKLTKDNYDKAVKDNNLTVYMVDDIENVHFAKGEAMQFAATLEVMPEFELPEYRKLPATRETSSVTDEDVEKALDHLRDQSPSFEKVERPIQQGDIAVIDYTGTVDGKLIEDYSAQAKSLGKRENFWVLVEQNSYLPNFTEQLVGAQAGEKRQVTVNFPADFLVPEIAGKQGLFDVTVKEVKIKNLPALDDAFAKTLGATDLQALRAGVQKDLANELEYKKVTTVRNQVVKELLSKIEFELPESAVKSETRRVVYDIVNENHRRGVDTQVLKDSKEKIESVATASAKERVKAVFVFNKIAQKENISITQQELSQRIYAMAAQQNMSVEKLVKEIEKNNSLNMVHEQMLAEKVITFIAANADVKDVPPQPAPAAPAPQA